MTQDELGKAREAVRPSAHDIAIASAAILAAAGVGIAHTANLFQAVEKRLAEEPIPEVARAIEGVQETELRQMRARVTTVTAIAHLEARGVLLPLSGAYPDSSWTLAWRTERGGGGYNVDGGFNYRLAAVYRAPAFGSPSPAIDSPAIFLDRLPPAMGAKVRRVLGEAVDSYRMGLFVAAAVLLGVASEAAWGQLARSVLAKTNDGKLRLLLDDQYASAAAMQRRSVELVRQLNLKGIELNALDAIEQTYRDLRNYAVHRPDESFDESRVDRTVVGTLLEASVEYFRRLYEIHAAIEEVRS